MRSLAYRGRLELIEIAASRCAEGYVLIQDPELLANGVTHPAFVRELLRRGADPNNTKPDGFGPLHRAMSRGALESVRQLLEAGADPNARSRNGRVPLYEVRFALELMNAPEEEQECLAAIEALLEAGADPLSVDDVGRVTFETLLYASWSQESRDALKKMLAHYVRSEWL